MGAAIALRPSGLVRRLEVLVDPTRTIKSERDVVIWRVDVTLLRKEDWKYEGSRAGPSGGGRTHTFGLKQPAKRLAGSAVYLVPGITVRGGRPVLADS